MAKKRGKTILTVTETEPDPMPEDERARRLDAALNAVALSICGGINARRDGKSRLTPAQVRSAALRWAKNSDG